MSIEIAYSDALAHNFETSRDLSTRKTFWNEMRKVFPYITGDRKGNLFNIEGYVDTLPTHNGQDFEYYLHRFTHETKKKVVVADIGCSASLKFLHECFELSPLNLYGIGISSNIDKTSVYGEPFLPRLTLAQDDIHFLDRHIEDNSVDLAACSAVMPYLADPWHVVSLINSTLKPGKIGFVHAIPFSDCVPNAYDELTTFRLYMRRFGIKITECRDNTFTTEASPVYVNMSWKKRYDRLPIPLTPTGEWNEVGLRDGHSTLYRMQYGLEYAGK